MMDESNLTIEYYIEPEAEKDCRRGQTFNWDTATYGKVLDFGTVTHEMDQAVIDKLSMDYTEDGGQVVFTSHAWRRMFEVRSPLIRELMLKFFNTCRFTDIELGLDEMASERFGAYWAGSLRVLATKADLRDYWTEISSTSDFMTGVPSYTAIRDPLKRLCHRLIAFNISGRSQAPEKVTATDLFYLRNMDQGQFGDSYESPKEDVAKASASDGSAKKKGRTVAVTTEDMQKKKNDVKARTTLLLSLPDEHQLRFSNYKTAQELWAAILKTFGDCRNMSDLDTMSLDDLYNHLKVYESEVQKKSESNSQNMAFISSAKHSNGNEEVNTASVFTASTNVFPASANIGAASISQDTACAYIASQSNGSQIKFEYINQIDEDDME
uniref:Uncharacterized protein n=1 Tax=Tanacetum cinerariifolium TaxID=118510 RepID=A0A6L2KX91_TANCI|nr:hypothetical protein [Tanacetum cinerariifolium]